jgi:hypothetical protein
VRLGRDKDPLEPCRSLDQTPDLFLIFAKTAINAEGVLNFIQKYGPLTFQGNIADQGERTYGIITYAGWMRTLLEANRLQRPPDIEKIWGGMPPLPGDELAPAAKFQAGVTWNSETRCLEWQFRPASLLDGLWLQFNQALMRDAKLEKCKGCGAFFEAGTGTGRRLDALFCCDEHRIAFNSLKRSRESSERPQGRKR